MTAVLATKLFEPRVPKTLVSRPRLVQRLRDGLSARVTLVSAPAGYGKSTLLSEWRASPEGAATRVAWVSIDEADNDPVRFWLHLSAALQQACDGLGARLAAALQRPAPGPLQPGLEELVNEMAALDEPLVVVLDDLHAASGQEVSDSLGFVVAHLPPHVRLVVVSRADPPLPLAALRARGDLTELRMSDLRFTHDEADSYFDRQGISLDGDSLELLESRTEGWVAGLHLAALTLADLDDPATFVRTFAGDHRAVEDYLVEEVLAHQPGEVQEFLLSTCVLERMSGPLCDAITGRADGQAMLRMLESTNLFVVALDTTRTWYRYHHLFGELLRRELRSRRPDAEPELRQRAARWLAAEGLVAEAVPQAVAAEAWDLVIDIGTVHGLRLLVDGDAGTLRQMYGAPSEALRKRPEATLGFAWLAMISADLDRAQSWLELSDVAVAELPDVPPGAVLDGEILWAALADRRGDIPACLARVDRVLDLLAEHPEVVGIDRDARRGRVLMMRAESAIWDDLPADADAPMADALAAFEEHRPARGVIEALGVRALLALWDGRPDDARRDADDALALERERQLDGASHGAWALLAIGTHHCERLELDDAQRYLARALEVFRTHRAVNCVALTAAAWADWLRLGGLALEAIETVRIAHGERGGAGPPLVARALARASAAAHLALGDVERAAAACESVGGLAVMMARIELAGGRPDAAIGLVEDPTTAAAAPYRRREHIEALAVSALGHAAGGDERGATERLASAFRAAAPVAWVAPFIELGAPLRALAAKLPLDPAPAASRLRRHVLDGHAGRRAAGTLASSALVEPLSERELAVLRRLPSSLSNQEIAGLLYVSLNTVKTQIQSIYRKLGVNSRHEAIERARQLGLL